MEQFIETLDKLLNNLKGFICVLCLVLIVVLLKKERNNERRE